MNLPFKKLWLIPVGLVMAFAPMAANGQLAFQRIVSGLSSPVFVTHAPGDPDRLFICLQGGQIRIYDLNTNSLKPTPFMTVPNLSSGGERGLLGLAFHPDYQNNGYFYVNFTDNSSGDTRVTRFTRTNADTGNPSTAYKLIEFHQPQSNHNAGWIDFGMDGYLYIASGDGGGANDSGSGHTSGIGNAQDITNNLLGKMLRIDVNSDDFPSDVNRNYAIPADNPFVGVTGDDEIYTYGLRNPWRCSFDRETGDLYMADVGQNAIEEVSLLPFDSPGGENYGWRNREGTAGSQPSGGSVDPIYTYNQGASSGRGFSITGGYVYRGPLVGLRGNYFFSDYVWGGIRSIRFDGSNEGDFDGNNYDSFTNWASQTTYTNGGFINNPSSFGEDLAGNLYVCDLSGGEIFRLTDVEVRVPDTLTVVSGAITNGGDVSDLEEDENQKVIVRAGAIPVCTIDIESTSSTSTPSLFTFTLAASTRSSRPNVVQIIELFNYHTGTFEELDTRPARVLGDAITTVQPTGDLTRFVQSGTLKVRARLTIRRTKITRGMTGFFDQAIWTIAD